MTFMDRVEIATPCPTSWDGMEGNDQVRFCGQCEMNVYNFSEMTAEAAEALILGTEGRVCGRFFQREDGTIISKDCPVGLAALRKRVAAVGASIAAGLALMLGLFGWRSAQAGELDQHTPRRLPTAELIGAAPPTPTTTLGTAGQGATPICGTEPMQGRVAVQPPRPPRARMGKIAIQRPPRVRMGEMVVQPQTPKQPKKLPSATDR